MRGLGDGVLACLWLAVLAGGVGASVLLRRWGLPRTHVRDVLHVGAGVWVLGWPWWSGPTVPVAITLAALLGVAVLPPLAARVPALARVSGAVAGGEERWSGIVLYTLSFAGMTALGLVSGRLFPAGAALLALALGDGVGGAVGLRFGRRRFRVGAAKVKSVEGTVAVAVMSAVGVALAAGRFGAAVGPAWVLAAAVLAAAVEAVSPRASDNVLLPVTVWGVLTLGG